MTKNDKKQRLIDNVKKLNYKDVFYSLIENSLQKRKTKNAKQRRAKKLFLEIVKQTRFENKK